MANVDLRLASVVRLHRPLVLVSAAMALLGVVAAIGLVVDDRELLGAPIWLKTFKFTVSIALYTFTMAWMISLLPKARRWGWWLGTAVAASLAFEMVLIVGQNIVRGTQLHFNMATPADALIHNLLATGIYLTWVASLGVAVLLLFQRLPDKAQASAVRGGVGVALAGLALAMLMFTPTPEQQATHVPGTKYSFLGAHSVGVPDGGPGLPGLGWSTTGGDLRVPHFIGMHALQLLPLLAFALGALALRHPALRDQFVRRALVRIASAGYLGLLGVLTWQALRGQPVVHPDGWTLLAAGGVLTAVLAASALVLRSARGRDHATRELAGVRGA